MRKLAPPAAAAAIAPYALVKCGAHTKNRGDSPKCGHKYSELVRGVGIKCSELVEVWGTGLWS